MFQSLFKRVLGVVMLLVLVTGGVEARTLSDLDAVHLAAKQRALIMRVAKAHVQLPLLPHASYRSLKASIEQYDRNLAELEANSPNSDLNRRLLQLKRDWQAFKALAMSQPTRDSVLTLLEESDNLLVRTDILVRRWQLRLPQGGEQTHEQALQQSMLSERIGLLYAAHTFGVNEPWVLEELNLSMREYDKGLVALQAVVRDGDPLLTLDTLRQQWRDVRDGLQRLTETRAAPALLMVAMESLYSQGVQLGEQCREEKRLAMQGKAVKVGLVANVTAE